MTPSRMRRLVGAAVLAGLLGAVSSGCGAAAGGDSPALAYELTLDPSPPRVGSSRLSLRVADAAGAPVRDAVIRVEGNMNHAGMVPEFADAREVEPGLYAAELEFTMGGDWILTVDTTTEDGRTDRWTREVPGVRPE